MSKSGLVSGMLLFKGLAHDGNVRLDAEPAFKGKGPLVNQHGEAVGDPGSLEAGFHLESVVMRL